jgi:tetratricopeptide (TPR) repeat protein
MTALLQPVEPARRHVVIARTKGVDTVSSVDAATLRAVAERSDALFHVVMMESALDAEAALAAFQCNPFLMGLCWPKQRSWIPHQRRLIGGPPKRELLPDGRDVAAGAAATGGAMHQTMLFNEPTLTSAFQKALNDFRNGYILRYTPAGVARAGWHDIDVTVAGRPSYTIRARTGYAVESRPPEPAPAPPVGVPRRLAEFVAAYSAGRYDDVRAALGRVEDIDELLDEFERGGNPWPAASHREAAFALELTEPAVFANAAGPRDAGLGVIRRFGRLIRHPLEPDHFERYWHFAALTMLQGALRPDAAEPAVLAALARFPAEPQFVLARAIINDQRTAIAVAPAADAAKSAQARIDLVRQQYRAALAYPEAAVEAHIRLAWVQHRTRQHADALQLLTAAAASPIRDAALAYLQQLFTGHVLVALDRPAEARAAYQSALRLMPAQSARVALMNTLLLQGETAAAEALAEDIQTAGAQLIDPWTMYWQGQYRLYPAALMRLRDLIR